MSPWTRTPDASFVPADLDGVDWAAVAPLIDALQSRAVDSAEDFERWMIDRSELTAAIGESQAAIYIRQSCHTDDEATAAAWMRFLREVAPEVQRADDALDRRQLELHDRFPMDPSRYAIIERDTRAAAALFCEENLPLSTRDGELFQRWQALSGAQTVTLDGEVLPLQALAKHLESPDRGHRERVWRLRSERRLQDVEAIDAIFDEQIAIRDEIGRNAGLANYRDYAFRSKMRFDYDHRTCEAFHEACAEVVTPLARALGSERASQLGVDPLRPWDLSVEPSGAPPLRPFADTDAMVAGAAKVFAQMGAGLPELFSLVAAEGNLDLDSRPAKAPGGYQYHRSRSGRPFIFMNAVGTHRDLQTFLHESGHAFHSLLCNRRPLLWNRRAPTEFCEVASMSMEHLSMPSWGAFYDDPADLRRAQLAQLDGDIQMLGGLAHADAFQHWLYLNPSHGAAARAAKWVELGDLYDSGASYAGLEHHRPREWHRIPHLFGMPFYMIEYVIAGLGALQIWLRAREEGLDVALDGYKRALSLGGSAPLPALFEAAGIRFDFGKETLQRLMDAVWEAREALK